MRDYFNEMFEWDGNVPRKKKKQVLPDGARANFTMQMMDHDAYGFTSLFSDGTPDFSDPHKPGFRVLDVGDPARLAAERAYEERRQRLQDGWRRKEGEPQQDNDRNRDAASRTLTLDEARALADAAYEDRKVRLQNAWRNR